MAHANSPSPITSHDVWTAADLVDRFGDIALARVCFSPTPGTATEEDLLRVNEREERLCELVDGTLVEKAMSTFEAFLAAELIRLIGNFVREHDLGLVGAPDAPFRLAPSVVRYPDVSFVSARRLGNVQPSDAIVDVVPDLASEIISKSNTLQEMDRKLRDYFAGGVRLVWYVDPAARDVRVYESPDAFTTVTGDQTLTGGAVLPGFELPLSELFSVLDRES